MVTRKVIKDSTNVTAILPVTLAAPGSKPIKLFINIKKKNVSNSGVNFSCFFPILSLIISSLTNKINGSINPCKPLGSTFFLEYDLDTAPIIKNNRNTDINIDATFLVIDKSIISRPPSSII